MKTSSAFFQVSITHLGTLAQVHLTPGQRGKVLASFSKAIYLLTDDFELFWIVSDDAPMHRRALKVSSPLSGPKAGSPFYVQDHRLIIDPDFAYDMDNASVWSAPSIDQNNIVDTSDISMRIQTLFSSLDLREAKGFGNFIPDILRLAQNEPACPQPESSYPILVFARPFVMEMAQACLENQPSRILQNTNALIGLGAGLTPSGDDFLGGLLFTTKTLQAANSTTNFFDHEIIIERYRARTHPISFALLQDLANGYAVAPLHQIINGLLSKESLESIYPFVSQLTQIGHSTGWDLLTGLLTGSLIAYRSNYLISSFQMIQNIKA
jgi:Protein of unknown function (DUF2877)